jgi:hypothetical protein
VCTSVFNYFDEFLGGFAVGEVGVIEIKKYEIRKYKITKSKYGVL